MFNVRQIRCCLLRATPPKGIEELECCPSPETQWGSLAPAPALARVQPPRGWGQGLGPRPGAWALSPRPEALGLGPWPPEEPLGGPGRAPRSLESEPGPWVPQKAGWLAASQLPSWGPSPGDTNALVTAQCQSRKFTPCPQIMRRRSNPTSANTQQKLCRKRLNNQKDSATTQTVLP